MRLPEGMPFQRVWSDLPLQSLKPLESVQWRKVKEADEFGNAETWLEQARTCLSPFSMHWHHACKEMFQKLLVGKPAATSCLRQGYLLFWIRSAVTLSHQLLKTFKARGSTTSGDF